MPEGSVLPRTDATRALRKAETCAAPAQPSAPSVAAVAVERPQPPAALERRRLLNYELGDQIGAGGMGTVLRAKHLWLNRTVAIKFISPQVLQNNEAVERFRHECRAIGALDHPNIVRATDAGEVEDLHYLVTEFVAGDDLAALVTRGGRLEVADACEAIRQAALGLQHAHERGMAHRDIKPSNLWIAHTADGQAVVKVLDLGLARFTSELHQEGELTQTGQVMGTPDYIAPEQAQRTKEADIRSDIFSLGCTLFRMLTGQLPYQGSNVMEKLMARAMADAPRLRQVASDLPAGLEEIVARMLARDRTQRYQTPTEVARALERYSLSTRAPDGTVGFASQPTTCRSSSDPASQPEALIAGGIANRVLLELPPLTNRDRPDATSTNSHLSAVTPNPGPQFSPTDANEPSSWFQPSREKRGRSRGRRQRAQLFGFSALILTVLLGAFAWNRLGATTLIIDWPEDERSQGRLEVDGRQLLLPPRGAIPVPAGRAGKRTVRFLRPGFDEIALDVDLSRGESRTVRPEWRPTTAAVRQGNLDEIRRGVENLVRRFPNQPIPVEDGERQRLVVRYRDVHRELLGTADRPVLEALWRKLPSPLDGLAASSMPPIDRQIAALHSLNGAIPRELVAIWGDGRLKPAALRGIEQFVVQPQGRFAITNSPRFSGTVWDLHLGIPWMTIPELLGAAFSPDGRSLALLRREVEIWSLETRERILTFSLPPEFRADHCLAFVPESSLLAISEGTDSIVLWDLERSRVHSKYSIPQEIHRVTAIAVSPDGRLLSASGVEGVLQLWNLADGSGRTLSRDTRNCVSISFRPDSRMLAAGSENSVLLWELPQGELVRTIRRENFGVHSLSWSNDGTSLACSSALGGFQIWDPESGGGPRTVAARGKGNVQVRYATDDRLVACSTFGDLNTWRTPASEPEWNLPPQVTCAGMDPCGEWLAVGTTTPTLELRSLRDGAVLREWSLKGVPGEVVVSPDGEEIAVSLGESVEVFDSDSETSWTVPAREATLQLAYTVDPPRLVLAGPRHVTVWESRGLEPLMQAEISGEESYQGMTMGLSADGDWAVLAGVLPGWNPILELVHLKTGEVRRKRPIEHATHLIASPATRNYLAGLTNYGLRAVDASSLEVLGAGASQIPPPSLWTALCPLPGRPGDFVAGTADGRLFFLTMGPREVTVTQVLELGGVANSARQILPAPDGRHLALVMVNGTVWIIRYPSV